MKDEVWYVVRSRDVVHKRGCLGYRSLCWDGVCHFIFVGFWDRDPVGSEVMIPLPYPDLFLPHHMLVSELGLERISSLRIMYMLAVVS